MPAWRTVSFRWLVPLRALVFFPGHDREVSRAAPVGPQGPAILKDTARQLHCLKCCAPTERSLLGISADKLNLVVVWREAPLFSSRERAALAWTEALTVLDGGVSDEVYEQASAEFSEKELVYLTSAVASINVWNRFGVAYRWTPPARKQTAVGAVA